jgi:hypothetical protein
MALWAIFCYNKEKHIPMRHSSSFLSLVTSPRLILSGVSVLVLVTLIGGFFYVHSRRVMELQLREFLTTTATVASHQFNAEQLESFDTPEALLDPEFGDTVEQLKMIRESVPGIQYVYIMRKTDDPNVLQFVADADSLLTDSELDENRNGQVDEEAPSGEKPRLGGQEHRGGDVGHL